MLDEALKGNQPRKPGMPLLPAAAICLAVAAGACMVIINVLHPKAGPDKPAAPQAQVPRPPPLHDFVPPPPLADAPVPGPKATLFPVGIRPYLPPVEPSTGPRLLAVERGAAMNARPPTETPRLAWEAPSPPPVRLPAPPLARAATPEQASVPLLAADVAPRGDRLPPAADPTQDALRQAALRIRPALRELPAPFIRLTIPDPFEIVNAVRLRAFPPDDDPPAESTALPSKPTLPVKP